MIKYVKEHQRRVWYKGIQLVVPNQPGWLCIDARGYINFYDCEPSIKESWNTWVVIPERDEYGDLMFDEYSVVNLGQVVLQPNVDWKDTLEKV